MGCRRQYRRRIHIVDTNADRVTSSGKLRRGVRPGRQLWHPVGEIGDEDVSVGVNRRSIG